MVGATVAFALLFFTCVKAAPAPSVIELTWLRNSGLNIDLGAGDYKKANYALNTARQLLHLGLPDKVVDRIPEISFKHNVNPADVVLDVHVDTDKILSIAKSVKDKVLPVLREHVNEFILALKPR